MHTVPAAVTCIGRLGERIPLCATTFLAARAQNPVNARERVVVNLHVELLTGRANVAANTGRVEGT